MTARTRLAAVLTAASLAVLATPVAHAEGPTPARLPGYWAEVAVQQALDDHRDDVPLTGELALSAARSNSGPGEVRAAVAAIESRAETQWYGPVSATDVGALATAVLLVDAADGDPTSYGGVDLVGRLERTLVASGAAAGRADGGVASDVADQALVVEALRTVGSARAGSARTYLLAQQCAAGWFARDLPAADAASQTCDPTTSVPDVPATARAVLAVDGIADAAVAQGSAESWLVSVQGDDGGFARTGGTGAVQSASTALAGHALAVGGRPAAAAEASIWLRTVQGALFGPCRYPGGGFVPLGLVAPTSDAFDAATRDGFPAGDRRAWLRVTALAAPAMRVVRADDGGSFALRLPRGYRRAGTTAGAAVSGLPARAQFCLAIGATRASFYAVANDQGSVGVPVALPDRSRAVRVQAWFYDDTLGEGRQIRVLAQTRFDVVARADRVAPGGRQQLRITRLAPRESVVVRYQGRTVARGTATREGVYVTRFAVGDERLRRAAVRVRGEFPDRRGRAFFSVGR